MSELAFNKNGERFEPPPSAAYWRVRRLQPGGRGVPEVVFGTDGAPLVVALDTGLAEFRELVNDEPGRYRLDAIDEDQRACDGAAPAYLQISNAPRNAAGTPRDSVGSSHGDQFALVEMLIKANTEMVKSIAEKFASVMDSAATLIRAADGAGLPAREPIAMAPELVAALRNAAAPEAEEEDDEESDELPPLAAVLQTAVDRAMPLLNHTINTKVLGLTPEQSIALLGGSVPTAPAKPAPVENPEPKREPAKKPAREAAPATPADFMRHVMAIEALLSPEEALLARQAIAQMPPAALVAWKEKLLAMSPAEAAKMVKEEIASARASAAESGQDAESDNAVTEKEAA